MLDDITARPYFLRAFYDWCVDMKRTPYLLAHWRPEEHPRVPSYLSVDGKIILNISPTAVRYLRMEKNGIFFTARFLGQTVEIEVSLPEVIAIYAQETGKGLSFPATGAQKEKPGSGKTGEAQVVMTEDRKKGARKKSAKKFPPPDLKVI